MKLKQGVIFKEGEQIRKKNNFQNFTVHNDIY